MSRRLLCSLLVIGPWVIGCQGAHGPETQEGASDRELPILWQQAGSDCQVRVPLRLVARDAGTLAQVPLADVPVDFQSQMVLIATLGVVPTEGYGIRISRVWCERGRVRVDVRVQYPPAAEGPRALRPCSPYHIVVVPLSDRNVEGFATRLPDDPRGHNPYK
jgi:hypothetical protein